MEHHPVPAAESLPVETVEGIAGLLSERSVRVYRHDIQVFACWLKEQGLGLA